MGTFIPKITNFSNFGAVSPNFNSDNGEIWRDGTDLGHPPRAKFCKNGLGICTLKIFTKNYKFLRFLAT